MSIIYESYEHNCENESSGDEGHAFENYLGRKDAAAAAGFGAARRGAGPIQLHD
jgi:hypothetical protein